MAILNMDVNEVHRNIGSPTSSRSAMGLVQPLRDKFGEIQGKINSIRETAVWEGNTQELFQNKFSAHHGNVQSYLEDLQQLLGEMRVFVDRVIAWDNEHGGNIDRLGRI